MVLRGYKGLVVVSYQNLTLPPLRGLVVKSEQPRTGVSRSTSTTAKRRMPVLDR